MDEDAPFGFRRVPVETKQGMVDDVFHSVARRYDLMNDLMSGGLHRVWKEALVDWLAPPRSGLVGGRPWSALDVAGGTGDVAMRIARRAGPRAEIVVCDINGSMLDVGRTRAEERGQAALRFVEANAEALPFADSSFDAYTIAFGIRNVPRMELALAEAFRVLRRGGRFLCLEFSRVDMPVLDRVYDLYSFNVIPAMGRAVTGDADSYRYLVESIRTFPSQERFADRVRGAGFGRVAWRNFTGGVAALHSGWKL